MSAERIPDEHLAYYESGVTAGIEIGRRQVQEEIAAEWALIKAVSIPAALREPYDVLSDRRGQHARAAAHRRLMAERGVVAS